jgi:hypothetical protein
MEWSYPAVTRINCLLIFIILIMDEISNKFVHGDYEECMALVVNKITQISRFYS